MTPPAEAKRRLFFALWPDDAVRRQIAALSRQLCKRPVPDTNLHLTLLFLGQVDEIAEACFCAAAARVQSVPFTVSLNRYGGWARKRIQWLGPSAPPAVLEELADALYCAGAKCGFEVEKRPFVPHVTLSRKAKKPLEGPAPVPVVWHASDFVLAESVPSPDGVRYVVRERWAL